MTPVGTTAAPAAVPENRAERPADGAEVHAAGTRPETVGDGASVWSTLRNRLRRWSFWLVLLVLLCGVVALELLRGPAADRADLSPGNAAPNGAKAVAEVLRQQGVQVVATGSLQETRDQLQAAGATLLVHDPDSYLAAEQLEPLKQQADHIVLLEPGFEALRALAPGVRAAGVVPAEGGNLPAGCTLPGPTRAGEITRGGLSFRGGSEMCFAFETPAGDAGPYVLSEDGATVVLGAGHALSNEAIAQAGNAALALNTLGATDRLVWYRAGPQDMPVAETPVNPMSLLPGWVLPVSLWLMAVGVAAMFWRGRRLGPLVAEPLPVLVRSAETIEGRARLYQSAKAVGHAADNLRAATLTRLAAHLRLPAGASSADVVHAVARNSGRARAELERILRQEAPGTESRLVAWAQELQQLEKEIMHR
ncbi:DUF4350 domain-containing protein [Arthrobacter sulfonylureivorans]|uniref:DUF4350 domain-containing protein n=1 Tax=Arthrobacter sulfonylureivorans TaxID=2486855 RepID=A0ABY3W9P1_9MICC|nr:DUF4350 domain-containing protein [Arthrobacter sulfonylureivorans]UNK47055.1 DUF4350 domain-containing protein [Arthrobacter sulfonylureivorans]